MFYAILVEEVISGCFAYCVFASLPHDTIGIACGCMVALRISAGITLEANYLVLLRFISCVILRASARHKLIQVI